MATTKIWPVHDSLKRLVDYAGNPQKTEFTDLSRALHYAANSEKTHAGEQLCFVSGVNCDPARAYEQMMAVKRRFGKLGGNVAYHGYQSFKPGEVTPEQCHAIGVRLAKELWGRDYQVLVTTHLDREHLHNHFLINSVSYVNGKKFNDNKRCYYRMREVSDRLCAEQGLSVIEHPKEHTPRSLYFAEKNAEPTRYNLMREALDAAICAAIDRRSLQVVLRDHGYLLNCDPKRKYATIRSVNGGKAVRLFRLGEQYDLPAINKRLAENRRSLWDGTFPIPRRPKQTPIHHRRYRLKGSVRALLGKGSLLGLYLHYCYVLGILPKNSARRPRSPELREELRRLEQYDRQVRFLAREKLETAEDVQRYIDNMESELEKLSVERQRCYNRLRRCDDPDETQTIRAKRNSLTERMRVCRRELSTAKSIPAQAEVMRQNLLAERRMTIHRGLGSRQKELQRNQSTER